MHCQPLSATADKKKKPLHTSTKSWIFETTKFQSKSPTRKPWERSQASCSCVTGAEIRPDRWHDNQDLYSSRNVRTLRMAAVKWLFLASRAPLPLTTPSGMSNDGGRETMSAPKTCTVVSCRASLQKFYNITRCVWSTCPDKKILLRLAVKIINSQTICCKV